MNYTTTTYIAEWAEIHKVKKNGYSHYIVTIRICGDLTTFDSERDEEISVCGLYEHNFSTSESYLIDKLSEDDSEEKKSAIEKLIDKGMKCMWASKSDTFQYIY